jgi:hypothetical protein
MKKTPVLHPFFFAIYAILGVYAQNPQELPVAWILRPLLVSIGIAALFYLLVRKWTGNRQHAGLITTLVIAWLFSGHIRNVLVTSLSITPTFSQDVLFLAGWGLLLIFLGSTWLWAKIKVPELVTNFLNVTSWVVILLPTYFVIVFIGQAIKQADITKSQTPLTTNPVTLSETGGIHPDIYVIILDAYGREDFLNDVFEYDNHSFTNFLKERGFYIAEQSRPNYPQTQLSLSSLLNLQYLNDWAKGLEETNYRPPLTETIRHSEVRRSLTEIGYQTINIPNSTFISNIEDANVYLPMNDFGINQFEGMILSTTTLNIFTQKWKLGLPIPGYTNQRQTIQYQLDTLKTIPSLPSPKFVFIHILAPHPPFVFDKDGNPVQANAPFTLGDGGGFPGTITEYEEGYRQQITYINKQMMEVIDVILEKSVEQPIIVLQGDHGPGSRFSMLDLKDVNCLEERYSILNAYYFPNEEYNLLYPSITPVNSFRVIFNTFFGTDLPLLEDKNYYASYASPYQLMDVTNRIEPACEAP